jgi:cytochrome c-type biogenesis protein CcmF
VIVDAGQIALVLALIASVYAALGSILGVARRSSELLVSGRFALYSVTPLLLVATAALVYAFVTNDFSVQYVAENSNLAMPQAYTWVAFYAGNAGSMLYIAVVFSLMAVVAVVGIRKALPYTAPYAAGVMALVLAFLLGVMVFLANPLARLAIVPADGQGINPLLVHFGMFIHPPLQMAGLVSVAIPFSIAIGALLANRGGNDEWVDQGRLWGMISWMILTIGLLLGSWWAYTILGWGGYWAWDPVENASFLPWLTATAFLHSIIIQEQRGILKVWNVTLIWLTFTLVILGTFTTRSGILSSVHSFAQSPVGPYFLVFLALTTVGFLLLLYQRMPYLQGENEIDSISSREGAFLANNWLFAGIAFVVLWGTFFPMFSEILTGERIAVAAPWFNRVAGPLFMLLFVLMGVGPLLGWRRTGATALRRQFTWPAAAALVSVPVLLLTSRNVFPVAGFSTCIFVAATIVQEFVRGVNARRRTRGEPLPGALWGLMRRNGRRYGGYVIHFGIVLIGVAIIGNEFYQSTTHVTLASGGSVELSGYTLTYTALETERKSNHTEVRANLQVTDSATGRFLSVIVPRRNIYDKTPDQPTSEVGLRMTPAEDVYVILNGWESDGNSATFTVYVNPLTMWMWVGGLFVVLGTAVSVWPHPRPAGATRAVPSPFPESATAGQATA